MYMREAPMCAMWQLGAFFVMKFDLVGLFAPSATVEVAIRDYCSA